MRRHFFLAAGSDTGDDHGRAVFVARIILNDDDVKIRYFNGET